MAEDFKIKGYSKVRKVFEEIQPDLELLKKKFPLGKQEFRNTKKQNGNHEEKWRLEKNAPLYRMQVIQNRLYKSNKEWEEKLTQAGCNKEEFFRPPVTLGKKEIDNIRFERKRYDKIKRVASEWKMELIDPLSEEEWNLLSRFEEWTVLRQKIWERLCLPDVTNFFTSYATKKVRGLSNYDFFKVLSDYGSFIDDMIESFDFSKGKFENYVNKVWSMRKKDYLKEETDSFFKPRKKGDGQWEKRYTEQRINEPLRDSDGVENGTFEDLLGVAEIGMEDRMILKETLCQIIIELAGNIIRLKKDKTLYMPLFYTELVVYLVKVKMAEEGCVQIRKQKQVFEVMSLSFLDFFMEGICRTILKIQQSSLKKYGEVGFYGTEFSNMEIDWPFRIKERNIYTAYMLADARFKVAETSIEPLLSRNYKKFEKILQGLFDSREKEELLSIFSNYGASIVY